MKTTIYIADDDPILAMIIADVFKNEGYNEILDVTYFKSHFDFVMDFDNTVDIAIIDISMERDLNIKDTLDFIQKENSHCFYLLMSGETRLNILMELWNLGANGFILKGQNDFMKAFLDLVNKYHKKAQTRLEEIQKDFESIKRLTELNDNLEKKLSL